MTTHTFLTEPPPSITLPEEVRRALIAASKLGSPLNGRGGDHQRNRAIDDVVAKAKRNYPHFFRQENHHESET